MNLWNVVTVDQLPLVLSETEIKAMRDLATKGGEDPDAIFNSVIRTVSNEVREAILNNSRNRVDPALYTIPETLQGTALAIVRLRLLIRFSQRVTDERKAAADEAEQKLKDIAAGKWSIMAPDGTMPPVPGKKPCVSAPDAPYDVLSHGLFPSPHNPTRRPRRRL